MRAVVIREHGGPEVLHVEDMPIPDPGPMQVRVAVKACGMNHIDLWLRKGQPAGFFHTPLVPGADIAGVVDACGPGVDEGWIGKEVIAAPQYSCGICPACVSGEQNFCRAWGMYGETRDGGCREYCVANAAGLAEKPAALSFPEAATLPLVNLTAWHMLVGRAGIRPGMTVLIHAAGSGVSSAGIQIAKLFGAEVITTASTDEKLARAKALGADHVINYKEQDFQKATRAIVGRAGVDIVFDHIGLDVVGKSLRLLKRGGSLVTCGTTSGNMIEIDMRVVFFKNLSILGSTMGGHGEFSEIIKLATQGKIKPILDSTFPIEKIRDAHVRLESRKAFGKVVITMGEA